MDYNDNDYEGQNLHIAGEESSKLSVLRPFALPKFDFDDNLHGHLRFDSLVENEVFLGISSQEDNHWIEDFSRGGNGIGFSSTAAESCPLPRHINVWSEATSSESVEMLLKAVGQEEMVPGGNMIEDADPGDHLEGSISLVENEAGDYIVDGANNGIPVLPPGEYGVGIDKDSSLTVTTENSSFGMNRVDNNQGETCSLVDGSLSHQMHEDVPVLGKEIDIIESSSKNIEVSVRESVDKDNISSINSSLSCSGKYTLNPVGEQDKRCNETDAGLSEFSLETDNVEKHCSHETTSGMQFPKEEHAVDACIVTMVEASSAHGMEESVSKDDGPNEVVSVVEPAECSQHSTGYGTEIKQLCESDSMLHERSSIVLQGEGVEGLGVGGSDTVTPAVNASNEMKQGPVSQSPDRHKIPVGNEAVSAESNSSLEAPCATHGSTILPEVQRNCPEKDHGHETDDAAGDSGKPLSSTASGESCEKLVTDAMEDASNIAAPQKENVEDGDHFQQPLIGESTWACTEDPVPIQVDGHESDVNVSTHEKESEKLPLVTHEMVFDDIKGVESPCHAGGVELQKTSGPKPESSVGIHPALNTEGEGTKLAESCIEGDQSIDSREHFPLSSDMECKDQSRETESEAPKQPNPSVLKESQDKNEPSPASDIEDTIPASLAEEIKTCKQSDSQLENSSVNNPSESSELCTNMEHSASALVSRNDGVEAEPSEEPMLAETSSVNIPNESSKELCTTMEHPSSALESRNDGVEAEPSEEPMLAETSSVNIPNESSKELCTTMEHPSSALESQNDGVETEPSEEPMLAETSIVNIPNESSKELCTTMEHPASALVSQNKGVEADPSEEPMLAEKERSSGEDSSVAGSTVKVDKSNEDAVPGASYTDLSQSEANNPTSIERNAIEIIGETLKTSETSGVNDPLKEDETFTFDTRLLGDQSAEDAGKGLQSFPGLQASKMLTGEEYPTSSVSNQTVPIIVKETSHVSSSTPVVCPPSGDVAASSERKSRRGGNRSGKGSSKKGNLVKETSPLKQTVKGDRSSPFLSPLSTGQLMTFESGLTPKGPVSIPTSSLPDLNTSAPSSSFFQQPFTDLQQVQLRAQIFVYGSLIQGAPPDEACMVSAFGMSDGARNVWERSWRACVEKLHSQQSQGNNIGTPVPSRSGAKAPDQTNRQSFLQSEILPSTAGRPSNKVIPSPVNHVIPLSSPLWNMSTPSGEVLPPGSIARSAVIDYQAVSPLNFQTPPIRNYITHSNWPAQAPPAPFPVPWLASSQSSPFEISTSYPAFPITEPVKLTTVKDSPLSITSGKKHMSPIPTTNTGETAMLAGNSSLDLKKVKVSTGQTGDIKTRKRKKSSGSVDVVQIPPSARLSDAVSAHEVSNQLSVAEDLSRISLIAQNQIGLVTTPVVGSYYSTSVAVSTPSSFVPKGPPSQAFPVVSPSTSSGHLSKVDFNMDKRAFNIEGFSKVEEAKLQAQEAAAHAASAISHCESVWSQLDLKKSSGLTSDAESKLASACAAIAAAASVAKAASAAAKIASDAAVQAKQMAEEAMMKPGTSNTTEYDSDFGYNSMNLVNESSTSILKDKDRNNAPSLAISAAREAAKKRIEAASAATKHAENLDAILKAAELAAEAVSHAGKVVAMGDPFTLRALAEAGPSNFWKLPQGTSLPGSKSNDMNTNNSFSNNAAEVPSVYNQHEGPVQRQLSKDTSDHVTVEENLISSVNHGENRSKHHNDRKVSDSAKTTFDVSDTDIESRSKPSTTSIREGSLVEVADLRFFGVFKDRGDSKKAWFSASIRTLKDVEALVCYDGLQSDEGSEQLKEWISIEAKDGETPRVRVPHPMTGIPLEGTRKRRRAAVRDYTWSVGDHVDVWMLDCWREGIIAEKNNKDATSFSIHFPAQGETLAVKVWHLRPSLIWSNGEWTEWCKPGQDGTHEGDTPVEKRPKLASTSIEAKGKSKVAKNIDFAETGGNKESKLPLSTNEKVFSVGSRREDNKVNMGRTMRSGVEKEGSRVVFGVPKPGKKRKFMEVSKHYVSDRASQTNVPNDLVKLSKFLVPQGSGSMGFRHSSKLDSKEKQVADSKPRTLKSGKPPVIPRRTLPRRDDSSSSRSDVRDAASSDHIAKGSTSNDENESSEQNIAEVDEASQGGMVFSSQALPQENRKKAVRNIKSDGLSQRKLAPPSGKSAKDETTESLISNAEPRRSNRRIQPTSRLLEGLQSSLIISKIPSSSHSKGTAASSRGNNNRG